MKVNLFKQEEVEFNLQEEKCEKISYGLLCNLTNHLTINKLSEDDMKICYSNNPKVVVFKTTEEFHKDAWRYDIDKDKEVLINQKGNIFCYLKEPKRTPTKSDDEDINEQNTNDAPANTEENKGEQA